MARASDTILESWDGLGKNKKMDLFQDGSRVFPKSQKMLQKQIRYQKKFTNIEISQSNSRTQKDINSW